MQKRVISELMTGYEQINNDVENIENRLKMIMEKVKKDKHPEEQQEVTGDEVERQLINDRSTDLSMSIKLGMKLDTASMIMEKLQ